MNICDRNPIPDDIEKLRAEHAERLDARRQKLRFDGEYRGAEVKPPHSKLIRDGRPEEPVEDGEQA
jgi:hypothetical protein